MGDPVCLLGPGHALRVGGDLHLQLLQLVVAHLSIELGVSPTSE